MDVVDVVVAAVTVVAVVAAVAVAAVVNDANERPVSSTAAGSHELGGGAIDGANLAKSPSKFRR